MGLGLGSYLLPPMSSICDAACGNDHATIAHTRRFDIVHDLDLGGQPTGAQGCNRLRSVSRFTPTPSSTVHCTNRCTMGEACIMRGVLDSRSRLWRVEEWGHMANSEGAFAAISCTFQQLTAKWPSGSQCAPYASGMCYPCLASYCQNCEGYARFDLSRSSSSLILDFAGRFSNNPRRQCS